MASKTDRLYYADSYLARFTATVLAHGAVGGRAAVALDRSVFYPEGGGQPADYGTLGGIAIADVQAEGGVVWHALARAEDLAALPLGARVEGAIDWPRRLDHMQQHCGQHLLTAAFIAACGLATTSFHLGDDSVTIDLDAPGLTEAQARAAEDLANAVIWDDLPVTARFVTPEELASLPLRKPPSVAENVRVVSIADFDHSACGGTHPRSAGGVGAIRVIRWGRQRGGVRVEFACGGRALAAFRRLSAAAGGAAAALSVGADELPAAVERLQVALRAAQKELEQAQSALDAADAEARYAVAEPHGAARLVRAALPGLSVERLRRVAQAIAGRSGGVAILGAPGERAQLVVACAADSGRDARQILQAGLPLLDGRGGGGPTLAQGGGPRSEQIAAALDAMAAAARA
ncbi:alanyl-tRNA editing protein [Oscillochloris sp. ZM17-4]|uniref:alanyl-tRNA editing protein n=1 Tax=Oscillochloris sp. ZM17-4 TaxID=2866714 RepID=UPI001C735007|nr:DHHA1 domain-containing protein [Oscillochloris sp. ZM17-4]MBX0326207.1 alanyl-tRNA editing protein [Oscillochloris sp. ZM17-4]